MLVSEWRGFWHQRKHRRGRPECGTGLQGPGNQPPRRRDRPSDEIAAVSHQWPAGLGQIEIARRKYSPTLPKTTIDHGDCIQLQVIHKRGKEMPVGRAGGAHGHGHESLLHQWIKRFVGASTVASIVVLTQWFWNPLEEYAMVVAAPFDAVLNEIWGSAPRGMERIGIVKIDEARYKSHYQEKSPLDRCRMAADLQRLAEVPGIRTIAVDFDLSPIDKDSVKGECQQKLDKVIASKPSLWVLMAPAMPKDEIDAAAIEKWRDNLRGTIQFADVTVTQTRNFVRDYTPKKGDFPTFGLVLDERIRGHASEFSPLNVADGSKHIPPRRISFKTLGSLFREGNDMGVDDQCLNSEDRPTECSALTTLIFGSGFTALDHFTTPYGALDGVDIHAAIAACPAAGINHMVLFALEIALGMFILAPLFEKSWKRYFETASGKAARIAGQQRGHGRAGPRWKRCLAVLVPTRSEAAYVWIFVIVLQALLILLAVFFVGVLFLSLKECAVLEVPFGFVIGMLIDSAITSNVEVSSEELTTLQGEITRLGPVEGTDFSAASRFDPHVYIKSGLYLLLLAAAVTQLIYHWIPL